MVSTGGVSTARVSTARDSAPLRQAARQAPRLLRLLSRLLSRSFSLLAAVLLAAVCLPAGVAHAGVVASVDRSDIVLNESFSLEVTVASLNGSEPDAWALNAEPDVSALAKDFYVVSRENVSNTSIVNGDLSRSRTWTYVLMAKAAGEFVIPPIAVGNERSKPLQVTIAPVPAVQPGQSDIFVVTEVDRNDTYVQAQVLYTIKIYRAVPTRQPRLTEPDISGVDVLMQLAADDKSYDSLINGRNYSVVERKYAIFPQASGKISIAPAVFEARVLRNGRITGRKLFKSDPVEINVQPVPPPPDGFPAAGWFPARSVTLREEWSRDPDSLKAGEPITRRITVSAVGQLSTQIPVVEPGEPAGIKVYPDKPELKADNGPEGIRGTRTDQYAMIAVESGAIRVPAFSLPWWNTGTGAWQVATLPAHSLQILPSDDALPEPASPSPAEAAAPAPIGEGAAPAAGSAHWRNVSAALAGIWVVTLLVWWWSRRAPARPHVPERKPPPVRKERKRLLESARQAARDGDAPGFNAALLRWARLQWPGKAPRSIGEVAARVPEPLASELKAFCQLRYGPGAGHWDGASLARALRSADLAARETSAGQAERLPPLMPQT